MSTNPAILSWPASHLRLASWVPLLVVGLLAPAGLCGQSTGPTRGGIQVGAAVLRPVPVPTRAQISALLNRRYSGNAGGRAAGLPAVTVVRQCAQTSPSACRVEVTLDFVRN